METLVAEVVVSKKQIAAFAALAAAIAVLIGWMVFYFPFLSDDALISLRYAERFLDGKGLTWTDGERVEGYTNFAWVLLTALLGALRVDLIIAARALGIVGAIACVVVPSLTTRGRVQPSLVRVFTGTALMAASAPVAVWGIGALEHGFQAGVLVTAAWLLMRNASLDTPPRLALGVSFILLVWLRADGVVLVTALLVGNAVASLLKRTPVLKVLRDNVLFGLPPLVALLAQLLFRRAYYEAWVPNTALVKAGMSVARFELGVRHLREWSVYGWPVLLAVMLVLVMQLRREANKTWLIPLTASLTWFLYLATMGGDIFPAWRQVLLGLVPLALVISDGAEAWWERSDSSMRRGLFVAAAVLIGFYGWRQPFDPANQRAISERWEFEGVSLGPALREGWGSKAPLIAVDAAGTLPYFSRLPSLDLLGLNDRYIASHPPPVVGLLSTGHELGDGRYTWSRKPDILAFCAGMGGRRPCFLGGKQMLAMPGFDRMYQLVRYHTPGPPDLRGELWIRREDSVLGIVRADNRITIPAWLTTQHSGVTELHDGRFRAVVSVHEPAHVEAIEVPAGRWRVAVEPAGEFTLGVVCGGRNAVRTSTRTLVVENASPQQLGFLIGTKTVNASQFDALVLDRTDAPVTARCGNANVVLQGSALSTVVPDGAFFFQPEGALLLRDVPTRITLEVPHGTKFQAALDANDAYRLRAFKGDEVLHETVLPTQRGPGLFQQRFDVPAEADALELTPINGDPLSGIGYLVEVE